MSILLSPHQIKSWINQS